MIAWQHGGSWFAGCGVWSSVRWCRHRSLGSAHSLHGQQLEDSDVHAGTLPTYPYQHDKRAAPAPQTGAGGNSARAPLQGHARRPRRGRGAARRRAYGRCCGACRPRCCLRRPRLRTRAARAASPPRAVRAARLPRAQWRKRVMSRSWCVGAPAACALALRGEAPGALHVKSGLATQLPSLCQRSVWGDVQPAAASDLGNTAERKQALPPSGKDIKAAGAGGRGGGGGRGAVAARGRANGAAGRRVCGLRDPPPAWRRRGGRSTSGRSAYRQHTRLCLCLWNSGHVPVLCCCRQAHGWCQTFTASS